MTKEELHKFLLESKKEVEETMEEFNKHSRAFDKKVSEILSML